MIGPNKIIGNVRANIIGATAFTEPANSNTNTLTARISIQ
jgi:hypothetical protein